MAITTGYYPAQARLILNPTGFTTGGTDLGKVLSIHTSSIAQEIEFITEHGTGSVPVDASITGITVVYTVQLIDWTEALLGVITNHTNTTDRWQGTGTYKLGALLSSSQTSKLLIRPVNDANAPNSGDATKPMLYIPRAVQIAPLTGTWDPEFPVGSGFQLQIVALYDTTLGAPAAYGDSADFPAI